MKKKFLLISGLVTALSLSLSANTDLKSKIKQIGLFKSDSIEISEVIDNKSIYHVGGINKLKNGKKMPFDAFVTKDLDVVILGKGFKAQTGEELFIPKSLEHVKKEAAFTIGTGKDEYFLFTDPECPYCVKLEQNMNSHLTKEKLKKIKIHVVLFPLPFHKNAKNMSYYILSQKTNKDKYLAYKNIMLKKDASFMKATHTVGDLNKYNEHLERQLTIVNDLGVNGTPTLLDSNGKKVNPAGLFK